MMNSNCDQFGQKAQSQNQNNGVNIHKNEPLSNVVELIDVVVEPSSRSSSLTLDTSCGLCSFRPKFLQFFANKNAFLVVFCITSVLQGMFSTYLVSVLTTIEKLYQIQSTTTGFLMSAAELGQIGGVLWLTYYGGRGDRPKWIACGMLVFSFAALLASSPHFLFHQSSSSSSTRNIFPSSSSSSSVPTESSSSPSSLEHNALFIDRKLCSVSSSSNSSYFGYDYQKSASIRVDNNSEDKNEQLSPKNFDSKCSPQSNSSIKHDDEHLTNTVLGIFFISVLLVGIGSTATNTLGLPYIDDNVAPGESPFYLGITIGIKIFGPVFGFLLGSLCTSMSVNFPSESSTFLNPTDPQWIGAWWLGMVLIGISLLFVAFLMMSFPKKLSNKLPALSAPGNSQKSNLAEQNESIDGLKDNHLLHQIEPMLKTAKHPEKTDSGCGHINHHLSDGRTVTNGLKPLPEYNPPPLDANISKEPSLKDFPKTLKRLVKNDVLLLRAASSVLHLLPIAGIYTFLPKYLESQFQLTASNANAITGVAGIMIMGAGIFSSSFFMGKFKPSPRFVALWIAFTALIYCIGMVILMSIGCPLNNFVGLENSRSHNAGQNGMDSSCKEICSCPAQFSPICSSDQVTYLSPCYAGCTKFSFNHSSYIFSDCKCLRPETTAVSGFCPSYCSNLSWYIFVFVLIVLAHSTSEVGSTLLTLRCVDSQDKAMALGFLSFAVGLFGNVPCPIIYGYVVDWSCIFWEETCGKRGACRMYDPFRFRVAFHGITAMIIFIAFLVDMMVWLKASSIKFDEEVPDESQPSSPGSDRTISSTCPYVCAVGDSIMMNIFETKLPVNSTGELHARCAVTKFLIDQCWNESKFGSECLPKKDGLQTETLEFWDTHCTQRAYEEAGKVPCFWRWSQGTNLCSKEYLRLVSHLLNKKQIEIDSKTELPICCDYVQFSKCAKKNASQTCAMEIQEVIQRFFFKLASQKTVDDCSTLQSTESFKTLCKVD
ncbi:solute carrier organic anion transporter family member 74D-like [Brevipalpus obovatus]|uniref:solute carrier organic anion transporter family member 74D-like n=1 Tax=Brevipalpus obovatus TaxID=246614 RepID=UPI003D9F0E4F